MAPLLAGFEASVLLFGKIFVLLAKAGNVVPIYPTSRSYIGLYIIFFSCSVLFGLALMCVRSRFQRYYDKVFLVLMLVSFYNLIDFILFSFIPADITGKLLSIVVGVLYLPIVVWVGIKLGSHMVTKGITLGLVPLVALLCYFAIPRTVFLSSVEKSYKEGGKGSVHLIIYDGLSSDVLVNGGQVESEFENFRRFSSHSHLFTNAYPTGGNTAKSLAQLITGELYEEVRFHFKEWMVSGDGADGLIPISSMRTIFDDAAKAGYNNVLVGYYLPYLNSFEPVIVRGRAVRVESSFYGRLLQTVPRLLFIPGYRYYDKAFKMAYSYYLGEIAGAPINTFFYVHLNQPHLPFPYREDGKLIGRFEYYTYMLGGSWEGYYRNSVMNLDRRLGDLVRLLKAMGKYDESLIVLTSDHNWKGFDSPQVPLFIKIPYQKKGVVDKQKVDMISLRAFLSHYFTVGQIDFGILKG